MRETKASSMSPGRLVVSCFFCQRCFLDGHGRKGEGTNEEDPIKVFELAEEYRHEGVALYVLEVPFLKEDVGFVEEKYGFPRDSVLKDFLKLAL